MSILPDNPLKRIKMANIKKKQVQYKIVCEFCKKRVKNMEYLFEHIKNKHLKR